MTTPHNTDHTAPPRASTRAFNALLDSLREVADRTLGPASEITDEIDRAEGYRYLTHLLSVGFEFTVEEDPDAPRMSRFHWGPNRSMQGGNPDAIYMFAAIRGDRSYRITGRREGECYLSFMVQAGTAPYGGSGERVAVDVSDDDLDFAPDGSYQIVLSAQPHPGNWIELPADARSIVTRHYYLNECPPASDPDVDPIIRIDPFDPPPGSERLSDHEIARRIDEVSLFIRQLTIDRRPQPQGPPPFVAHTPNHVGPPTAWSDVGRGEGGGWGNVHFYYSSGQFLIEPDEALVMDVAVPTSRFWNVCLWNRYTQDLNFRRHRTSLHMNQVVVEDDGSCRIVIAHSDPGVPNWLDTAGHRNGTIFWRIFQPSSPPPTPHLTLVPLDSLGV